MSGVEHEIQQFMQAGLKTETCRITAPEPASVHAWCADWLAGPVWAVRVDLPSSSSVKIVMGLGRVKSIMLSIVAP